ncbi:hypothetical protein KVT40_000152 [Elsinoe batatas]|uniref:PLAC8 family-domain-containing protein n=1 Tax=Elsinoe batatas TaxID=2601811 RepID=A0A8K0L882_9PEZI|nr:hypothetical protein KVT40_000152 [Elsinoe batatas]
MAVPNTGQWTAGICDCGGCGPCMGAFFCYSCLYGRVVHRNKHFPRTPEETGFSYVNSDCLIMTLVNYVTGGCGWILQLMKRTEQRERFGIEGSGLNDCCCTFCCSPCTLAQANLDLKTRAEGARLLDQNGAPAQTYEKQETGMVYQPPAAPVEVQHVHEEKH